MSTIKQALSDARAQIPASEARFLLAEVGGYAPAWLVAHDDDELPEAIAQRYAEWVARRHGGEPIAYIIGWREFFGHRFSVTPDVLIPRPETELLVECALSAIAEIPQARVLDLGTGSGCIAIALALTRPDLQIWAVDASAAALGVAASNAQKLGVPIQFRQGNWDNALSGADSSLNFDVVLSNPPYIAPDDAHLSQGDLRFEPRQALAAAEAGFADLRHIIASCRRLLRPGGWLLCEHGYDQAAQMRETLLSAGFSAVQHADLAGILRVSGGQLKD